MSCQWPSLTHRRLRLLLLNSFPPQIFTQEPMDVGVLVPTESVAEIETQSTGSVLASPQGRLALFCAVSLLAGWRPLLDTFALALQNEAYTHILLILPVSAVLVFGAWRSLKKEAAPSMGAGAVVLAAAVVTGVASFVFSSSLTVDMRLSIRMAALVLWWIGSFILCLGLRAFRSLLFPLLFLLGSIPLPQAALDAIIVVLQQGSTWSARMLFELFGVPVVQDGFLIAIPGLTLQVAQECSSIRSSSMLLVTTLVLAQILLRSPWRKALVVAIAIPLSVAKNGLRIFTIAMLGTRVDPVYITGSFHHQGGVIFFAVALGVIFLLLWILRRGESAGARRAAKSTV